MRISDSYDDPYLRRQLLQQLGTDVGSALPARRSVRRRRLKFCVIGNHDACIGESVGQVVVTECLCWCHGEVTPIAVDHARENLRKIAEDLERL